MGSMSPKSPGDIQNGFRKKVEEKFNKYLLLASFLFPLSDSHTMLVCRSRSDNFVNRQKRHLGYSCCCCCYRIMDNSSLSSISSVFSFHWPLSAEGSPTADVADETTSTTELYAVAAFLVVLSVVGTVGNGVVLWVFWARRDRAVATLFIVVLAGVDLSTCVIVVPFTVYMELARFLIGIDAFCKLYQVWSVSFLPLGQVNAYMQRSLSSYSDRMGERAT